MLLEQLLNAEKQYRDQIAVLSDSGKTTYGELLGLSRRIAGRLRRKGVGKGDFVTIELERDTAYVASMIGTWMAGAAFAALDTAYPKDRLDYIASDCEAKVRINGTFLEGIENEEPLNVSDFPTASDHAVLIYTSGSTGRPKGVLHDHRSLSDACARNVTVTQSTGIRLSGETVGDPVPFSFIAGLVFVLFPLTEGAAVCVVPSVALRDPALMTQCINKNRIGIIYVPPKMLKVLSDTGCLKLVFTGSEKVTDLYRDDLILINGYGSSESCAGVLFFRIDKRYENTPIGKPVGNEKIHVLDENGNEADEGELCLAGHYASGYLNLPAETGKAFVPNPFADADGYPVLYRTGDLVRKDPDGNVVYLNRKDWMIKINGQRVEPGEIESAVRSAEGVAECAVRDFTGAAGQTYLCAFYTEQPGKTASEEVIRKAIGDRLPSYMMPAYFVKLDKLPVNANGKLDRKALAAPELSIEENYVSPRNETEAALCAAFEQALNLPKIGIRSDFFALGGDSIRVMVLQQACPDLKLSTRLIYEERTVERIAARLAGLLNETAGWDRNESVPLSQSQLGIFLSCEQREGEIAYNNPLLFRFGKELDANRFRKAVEQTVLRHPGLFARLSVGQDGIPVMRYEPAFENNICSLEQIRPEDLPRVRNGLIRPFLLKKDRLFRFELYQTESETYFFMDIHHVMFDGASFRVLLPEIFGTYRGGSYEEETFTAFHAAKEEANERAGDGYAASRDWMLKTFGDVEEITLPEGDRKNDDTVFKAARFTLDTDLNALLDFCYEHQVTENVLSAGAFGYLLSICAMSRKTAFATVYNGRHDLKTARTVTMLVKTLPVLCDADPAKTVSGYLSALKEQMMGAMVNDLYSFRELTSATGYTSDVLFTYQGDLFEQPLPEELNACKEDLPFNATGEKLSIQLFPLGGKLTLDIQYHGNLYSEDWIKRFAKQYEKVLNGFLSVQMLKDVRLVDEPETESLVRLSYGGDLPFDPQETYIRMLQKQASLRPDKTAVVDQYGSYTYKQLDELSNLLAHHLIAKGVGKRDFVALKMGRVKEFVLAIAGVQKAGGAYIPVDPAYPEDRIAYMLEDSGAKTVLTEETVRAILASETDASPVDRSDADNPAYMIYTSGSTGKPKGVVILHKSLTAAIAWRIPCYDLSEQSKNAAHPSFSFDASVDDLFPPLAVGGELHILSEQQRMDLDLIYEYLNGNGITGMTMSTQIGMSLINAHPDLKLHYMVVGGEKLLPFARTDVRVFNGYGPTEFTVASSVHEVDQETDTDIPIGKAVPNSYSFICDLNGNLLPQGMTGELCLAGIQISEGYHGRPELNKERFIPCPWLKGEKMYRTGDLAKYNGKGELEYCGRIDFQVKLRGFRIELGEVENAAAQFPGVHKAIALVKNKLLVLYYTADEAVEESSLKAHMAAGLTEYMVPSVFMRLDDMPLTPSGKIDRKALPEPARTAAEKVPPETDEEQAVFDILASVLGYDDFGVTDDFGDAGLTSLSAMQFAAALSAKLNKTVRMSSLTDCPTVRTLAAFLSGQAEEGVYEKRADYPLTKLQEGVFVECTTHPGTTVYNIPLLLKLDPSVDTAKLEKALTAVIDAHPYLKMRLRTTDAGDVNASRDDGRKIPVSLQDAQDIPGGLKGLVRPFNLMKEDLFRASIVKDGEDLYLFLDGHHLVFDGESLVVFMRELESAYEGRPVKPETYTGFEAALDESARVKTDAYQKAKAYYENLLDGVDTECVPIRDKDEGEDRGASVTVDAPVDRQALDGFLQGSGTTVNALWNAAFGLALSTFLAREDSVFTTVYNGRNDTRLQNAVGMYVHTLPVVFRAAAGETGKETVQRIARQLKDSMANDLYPFAEISRTLGVKADILFVYEGRIGEGLTVGGKPAESVPLTLDALKADLTIFIFETDGGFRFDCEYNARKYEEWNVCSLLQSTAAAFRALMNDEQTDRISLVSDAENARIDRLTDAFHPVEDTDIVTLFKRAAKACPDRNAVLFRETKITYRELDALTDRVAAHLRRRGIGRGDIVSVLVPRGEYMVIAALGVLKAGAAYEPLDPSYPPERLNFMVQNASAKCVIADGELSGLLSEYTGDRLFLNEIGGLPDEQPADPGLTGSDLFIVLYTSGTTGRPKGVMLEHRNLVNFCAWYRSHYDLTPESVVGAYASFGFDADMMDLYPALTTGAAVYIIPEDLRLDLNALDKSFAEYGVTHLFMTTQMGRMFAENMKGESLSHLSVGGETLAPLTPPEGFALWNGYGPTECTIFSTIRRIDRLYYRNPIGGALWNYRLYVVGKNGRRLPAGALGELWIAGAGVGRGYLDLPEQTKKVFIENPFDGSPAYGRVYRTGDIVRRLENGDIDFIGRNDGQVKIRGFRIELSEVESVIREYPGIKNVTIQAFDDKAFGGKFLAAYVVSNEPVDFGAVGEFIKSKKPPYMVPAAFMQLDEIPLTQNQKVNRRALPEPVRNAEKAVKSEPETALERELCGVFANILGMESVGATDNFFSLGGTSISAAKVAMFAAGKNYPVVYKDVFDHPTARELAQKITEAGADKSESAHPQTNGPEETAEEALKDNCEQTVNEIADVRPLGRTLLTGATGFLGSHLLKELLNNNVETVVLSRGNEALDAETRLSAMMAYYFDEPVDDELGKLLTVIDGDITNDNLKELLAGQQIDTIINSAACVKHFAADDIIERINVGGVRNLIEVAKEHQARLIQISTLSVAGENIDGKFPPTFRMKENQLYFGQDISNQYVHSKFGAEQAIVDAIGEGLDAKMIRVGNLMGRQSDGEFQINSITNSFIKSLRAYEALGYFPVSACDSTVDFSPIDMVAKAVVLLARTDSRYTVFHVANSHEVQMGDVIEEMNSNGFDIKVVRDDLFVDKLNLFLQDGERGMLASSLLTYSSSDHHVHTLIKTDNSFTVKALYRLGFKWPITDALYLKRIIEGLKTLRFFERTDI